MKMMGESMESSIMVFITASSIIEAKLIGQSLVEKQLAACSNIITNVHSIFVWNKELCNEEEVLLIIKTDKKVLDKVVNEVRVLHSYEVPEIIAIPIVGGYKDYLQWIENSVQ